MKRKCILALLLLLVLLTSVACGQPAQTTPPPAAGATAPEPAAEFAIKPDRATSHSIDEIVVPGAQWEKVATKEGGIFIEGVNFDSANRLWFIDVAGHAIYYVDENGAVQTQFESPDIMPNGARFIDDNTMLITDRIQGLIKFDLTTNTFEVLFNSYEGKRFNAVNDLVLDGEGGCYFTDPGVSYLTDPIGAVYYCDYSAAEPTLEQIETGLIYPNGITMDPTGMYLYVAGFAENQIICIPTKKYVGNEGTRVFARLVGGIGPDGVECDSDGNVYAAHLEAGEVVVIDRKGYEICKIGLPAEAGLLSDNLCLHEGYLYVCEASTSTIWRIAINTSPTA
ncbi:MAG: SMP-30/gluconolactonase/LRE family protein [Gracilibacteraceae bacterium]|jgi:gluconolactonase|nr:SMP-30/gluconolactonase/LRE family protein [Gracilibacteraceae bacterium]